MQELMLKSSPVFFSVSYVLFGQESANITLLGELSKGGVALVVGGIMLFLLFKLWSKYDKKQVL